MSAITDAAVAALAAQCGADVVTGDPDDIQPLLAAAGARVSALDV